MAIDDRGVGYAAEADRVTWAAGILTSGFRDLALIRREEQANGHRFERGRLKFDLQQDAMIARRRKFDPEFVKQFCRVSRIGTKLALWRQESGACQIDVAELHHFSRQDYIVPTVVANGAMEARIMTNHRHEWTGAISAFGSNVSGGTDRQRCILVVDDEPTIVELLASLLEDEGYAVLRAYDGEEALKIVTERSPDLVISDISLPRLSGIDLLRRLRASEQPDLPVILMSAIVRDLPVGQATFIRKPFDLDHVLDMVQSQIA